MHAELPFVAILVTLFLVGACAHSVRRGKATIAALCAWLAVTTFIFAVDAIVWASKVTTFIPVWCDLSTPTCVSRRAGCSCSCPASKFLTSAQLAFPACCLCICIERYGQLKPPEERRLPPSIRTANIVRYLLVAAVPLLYAALCTSGRSVAVCAPSSHVGAACVVQVRRYDIIEDIGCRSAYITAIPTLFIVSLPPVLLCIGTAMLSCKSLLSILSLFND
jgi:pheromone a factor receptor